MADGKLSAGHARALIGAADATSIARRIVEEGLSVRQTEVLAHEAGVPQRQPQKSRGNAPKGKDADTIALEKRLSDALGLKVSVEHRGESGKVQIAYRDLDQLDGIVQRLEANG